MSLSSLPLECLQFILQILNDRHDRTTLARLLQVNHYFCNVTLPYLYFNPFQRPSPSIHDSPVPNDLYKLIQMLLRNRRRREITPLLHAAFDVFPEKGTAAPNSTTRIRTLIDYPSFIHVLDLEQALFKIVFRGTHVIPSINHPRRLSNYVFKTTTGKIAHAYGEGPHDHDLLFPPGTTIGGFNYAFPLLRHAALSNTLRRDLTWALGSPIFARLQSLTIPLSDMDRYLRSVHRFKSLISVTFKIDEDDTAAITAGSDPHYDTELEKCKHRKQQQFVAMITFVERHLTLFPNQLQEANCPGDVDDNKENKTYPKTQKCPQEVQDKLRILLPSSLKPRSIDQSNWSQVAAKLKETDLGAVHSVYLTRNIPSRRAIQSLIEQDSSFLRRCRTLETLSVLTQGPGSLKWAVDERLAWNLHGATKAMTTTHHLSGPMLRPSLVQRPISLRSVQILLQSANEYESDHILGTDVFAAPTQFTDELDDLVFAFGETLTELYARGNLTPRRMVGSDFIIGQGWKLPEMKSLVVDVLNKRLLVDRDLFSRGLVHGNLNKDNKLERLELKDGMTGPYQCQDLYNCQPATQPLPYLKEIDLVGWPALTFHPDTLHQTPNLLVLRLRVMWSRFGGQFIPPQEELEASFYHPQQELQQEQDQGAQHHAARVKTDVAEEDENEDENETTQGLSLFPRIVSRGRRAPWTWDWSLPHLRSLSLSQEFAFLFQFGMLAYCPSLEDLALSCNTRCNSHVRILSLNDFMYPRLCPSSSSSSSLSSPSSARLSGIFDKSSIIVMPLLKRLTLDGYWSLDDDLRKTIFPVVFPNLVSLFEIDTFGFSLEGWLEALRQKKVGERGAALPKLKYASCTLARKDLLKDYYHIMNCLGLWSEEELGSDYVAFTKFRTVFSIDGDLWC